MAVKNWKNENWKNKAKENQDKAFELVHLTEEQYIEKPEKMIEFLKTASQLYQYSVNNLKLIYAQNPDATCVQSFEGWKKLGYSVLRGQKGIKIFVPVRTTLLKLDDGQIVSLSEATAEQKRMYEHGEIEGYKKTSYKIGNVFDIKQTNVAVENYSEFYVLDDEEDVNFYEKVLGSFERDKNGEEGFKEICKYFLVKLYLKHDITENEKELFLEKYQDYLKEKNVPQKDLAENLDAVFSEMLEQFKKYRYEDLLKEKGIMTYSEMAAYANAEEPEKEIPSMVKTVSMKTVSSKEHKNYVMLKELAEDVLNGTLEHMKFSAGEGYDMLTVEKIGTNRIAMGHYFELNGNLLADPDMEFEIDHENETMSALSFQNDSMQYYRRVEMEDGSIDHRLQRELNDFASTWLKNIKSQGYKHEMNQERIETNELAETESETVSAQEIEPLYKLGNYEFDEDGYLHLSVEVDGYQLEALYRVNDPDYGPNENHILVSIDYGYLHPVIEKKWDEIEKEITQYVKLHQLETVKEINSPAVEYEEKRALVKGDIIEYEGKRWRVTDNYNNFMLSAENLDPNDKNPCFQWIGNIEEHDYKIIKEIPKPIVALESTEDFEDRSHEFYTYHYPDGREGIRYRLVTIGDNGYLKPYLNENQFFITKELAEEYIQEHMADLEVISYDEIVHRAAGTSHLDSINKNEKADYQCYFEVLECMEFPSMGSVYTELKTVSAAIESYNNIAPEKLNLVPGIQFVICSENERTEIPLSSGRNIDLDMLQHYSIIEKNENSKKLVQEFIKEAKINGFSTYGNCTFLNEGQAEIGRRRRGR